MTNALGLYLHWPYCARICPYCDFNVYKARDVDAAQWAGAFGAELKYWAARIAPRPLTSIYFGGGTPSLAPLSVIENIIDDAQRLFGFDGRIEITIEANPNDIDKERLKRLFNAGVNRLSLGVQSFDDKTLAFLGRDHDANDARRALAAAREVFANLSFDLIYAHPDQTEAAWRVELEAALAYAPAHLSLYQLTVEPGTAFAKAVDKKRWAPAPTETTAQLFDIAQERTAEAGLDAYEISNHAREGFQSRHNLTYWRYQDYIGLGPGAHGRLWVDEARVATKAHDQPGAYLASIAQSGAGADTVETLDEEAQLIERLSMGLRLLEGVDLYADDVFYVNEKRADNLHRLVADGVLIHECGRLRASVSARKILDRVVYELLT